MQSHIRKVYACLAVTCHLRFWQDDRGLLRATAVTRGWNGYRNKSQHRKLTLEKKILPPLQQGFEPATFRSRVRRSNHWAIPAPRSVKHACLVHRVPELCESRGGRPGFLGPNSPYGLCGSKATSNSNPFPSEFRSCVKVAVVVLVDLNSPDGLCGRKAIMNLNSKRQELRRCVKVEVAALGSQSFYSPYGLCGRKATLNLNLLPRIFTCRRDLGDCYSD